MKKYILLPEQMIFYDGNESLAYSRGKRRIEVHIVTGEELAELAGVSLDDCLIFRDFSNYLDYCKKNPREIWSQQKQISPWDFYDELEKKYLLPKKNWVSRLWARI